MKKRQLLLGSMIAFGAATASAQGTSCLVIGEKTARVQTPEGERSPVFVAKSCADLRLLSGVAQVSWVSREGKPRVFPLTPQGVQQSPTAGSEERSVNVVWAELTTRRERQQPAYMRNFGGDRLPKVFVATDGIKLSSQTDSAATLQIFRIDAGGNVPLLRKQIPSGQAIILERLNLEPAKAYLLQVQRGALLEEWRWQTLSAQETADIDLQIAEINASVEDTDQRLMVQAMLFEQLKMRINLDLLVQELRSR